MLNFVLQIDQRALTGDITEQADDLVQRITYSVESEIKLAILTPPKSGRTYKRGRQTHQASARGEAPATDTGLLVNSIFSEFPKPGVGIVGIGAKYAGFLEFNLDRPYVSVSIEKVLQEF
jgi:hypothetical protein